MAKLKKDSAQRLLDGVCHLTGHRLLPTKDICERCRRPMIYYSVSLNGNYLKTEAQILSSAKLTINLNICQGDMVELTLITLKNNRYHNFHKKLKVRKPRSTFSFKFP